MFAAPESPESDEDELTIEMEVDEDVGAPVVRATGGEAGAVAVAAATMSAGPQGAPRAPAGMTPTVPMPSVRSAHPGWLTGAAMGPLLFALLFVAELVAGARLSMMGVHDAEIQRTILGRFGLWLVRQQAEVLAAYLVVGAGLGLAGAIGLALWDAARGRSPSRMRRRAEVLAVVGGLLLWRLTITVIRYPQLYAESLYAKGGAPRALQLFLTDHVPLWLVVGAGWAAIVAAAVGPALSSPGRRAIASALQRARSAIAARPRRFALAATSALVFAAGAGTFVHRSKTASAASAPVVPPAPAPSGTRPNILILAVDSLRADRVGPERRAVAPHLADLAARAVRFESAYVSVPRTFPSWATILSGRLPQRHGLRHMFPTSEMRAAVSPLLPERLGAAGFHTAVVSDFAGEIFSRMGAGFAERRVPFFDMKVVLAQAGWNLHPTLFPFVASRAGHRLFPALASAAENADPDRLADDLIDTIDRAARRGSPFFVTAFFSAPHFPYAAPDPYYRRFTQPGYRGPFRYHKPYGLGASDGVIGPEDIVQIRGLYDGAVAAVDDAVGRVLDALAARDLDRNTIIVVLADHGENLFDVGRGMGHGEHLRGDAALHIPLVIYDPVHAFPAHAVPGIVRDIDVAPTLAALAGAPFDGGDGVDLAPLLRGERTSLDLAAYAETGLWFVTEGPCFGPEERLPYPGLPALVTVAPDDDIVINPALHDLAIVAKHRALRTARWKLLYVPTRQGVRLHLYDLANDPEEKNDVAAAHPAELAALKARLYALMALDGSVEQAGFMVPPR